LFLFPIKIFFFFFLLKEHLFVELCNSPSNPGYWAIVSTQCWTGLGQDIGHILEWKIEHCWSNIDISRYWQHIWALIRLH